MDITKFSTESLKKIVQVLAPGSRMRKDIIKELILREKGEGDKEKDDKNLEKKQNFDKQMEKGGYPIGTIRAGYKKVSDTGGSGDWVKINKEEKSPSSQTSKGSTVWVQKPGQKTAYKGTVTYHNPDKIPGAGNKGDSLKTSIKLEGSGEMVHIFHKDAPKYTVHNSDPKPPKEKKESKKYLSTEGFNKIMRDVADGLKQDGYQSEDFGAVMDTAANILYGDKIKTYVENQFKKKYHQYPTNQQIKSFIAHSIGEWV